MRDEVYDFSHSDEVASMLGTGEMMHPGQEIAQDKEGNKMPAEEVE